MSTTNNGSDPGAQGAGGVGRLFERAPWAYLAQLVKRTRHVLARELLRQRLMELLQAEQLTDYVGPSPADIGEIDRLLHALTGQGDEEPVAEHKSAWPAAGLARREEANGQALPQNGSGEAAEHPRELV